MPNFAQITIMGHLARDGETKESKAGKTYSVNSVAVTTGWGDNKQTTWYNISAFGKISEFVGKAKKGNLVLISGEPCLKEYEGKNGKVVTVQIMVASFQNLSYKPKEEEKEADECPF